MSDSLACSQCLSLEVSQIIVCLIGHKLQGGCRENSKHLNEMGVLSLAEGDLLGAPLKSLREVNFKGTVQIQGSFLSAAADAAYVSAPPPQQPPVGPLGVGAAHHSPVFLHNHGCGQ